MDALETARSRCVGYRREPSRNGRRGASHEGMQFIASPREEMVAGQEFNVKNTILRRFLAEGSHISDLVYLYTEPGRVVRNADINGIEIPSGVLKYICGKS